LKRYVENPKGINIFPEANDNYLSNWENTANGVANTNWFKFPLQTLVTSPSA